MKRGGPTLVVRLCDYPANTFISTVTIGMRNFALHSQPTAVTKPHQPLGIASGDGMTASGQSRSWRQEL